MRTNNGLQYSDTSTVTLSRQTSAFFPPSAGNGYSLFLCHLAQSDIFAIRSPALKITSLENNS